MENEVQQNATEVVIAEPCCDKHGLEKDKMKQKIWGFHAVSKKPEQAGSGNGSIAETFCKPLTLSYLSGHISSENLKFTQIKKSKCLQLRLGDKSIFCWSRDFCRKTKAWRMKLRSKAIFDIT